ncbi:MAG: bestrophin family protein [Saprospiraceae bacterium]|nr:bestrophin family protein [Saprospiraceae bacterium]
MITYNPKDWWKLIFAFHKSDSFRILLPAMLVVSFYTTLIAYLENDVWHLHLKNTTVVHSLVGFVLSLLLVFRTNTAYDRWWEGRRLLGNFTNHSRSLSFKLNSILNPEDKITRSEYNELIHLFLKSMVLSLRDSKYKKETIIDGRIIDWENVQHPPNFFLNLLYHKIHKLYRDKIIGGEELLWLNAEIQGLTENMGGCERIRRTPIPYTYSLFLKKIIFLYIFTMPIGFVIEFKYWAVPIVTLVFYIFASIEVIAEEIENPFGSDANDLPVDSIISNIDKNTNEIFGITKV